MSKQTRDLKARAVCVRGLTKGISCADNKTFRPKTLFHLTEYLQARSYLIHPLVPPPPPRECPLLSLFEHPPLIKSRNIKLMCKKLNRYISTFNIAYHISILLAPSGQYIGKACNQLTPVPIFDWSISADQHGGMLAFYLYPNIDSFSMLETTEKCKYNRSATNEVVCRFAN